MSGLKPTKVTKRDIPKEFNEDTVKTIERIENCHNVIGVLYLRGPSLELYTVPEMTAQFLVAKLPSLNVAMTRAITEIDIQNEVVAYRIEANSFEITVTGCAYAKPKLAASLLKEVAPVARLAKKTLPRKLCKTEIMKIISNLLKDRKDEWLVHTTAQVNTVNPIVDRVMDDDSVEAVIMTNKEGAPILTNVSLTNATSYGRPLNRLASMTVASIKELDLFDEVLVMRLVTKKKEILLAPNRDFNVIVVQHARRKTKQQQKK